MSDELKTPWYVDDFSCIWDDDERPIADFALHRDAAAIVHRVNCHDKLVEALEDCIAELEASQGGHVKSVIAARAALELAKGHNLKTN